MFLGNPAWTSFLIRSLNFTSLDLGFLALNGAFFSYAALLLYKNYMVKVLNNINLQIF